MTFEILFMLALLIASLVAFTLEKLPTELVGMLAFSILLLMGYLPPERALQCFANPGPIAVGALFILSAALERSGIIDWVGVVARKLPNLRIQFFLPILILTVATISAFINNTPVVVVFLPVVIGLSKQMQIPASKLLIPLSFASIFGGTCTLVGTSTNIIVSSVAESSGLPPFSMFELSVVGLPLLLAGTIYLTFFGPKLLPVRETLSSILSDTERREYVVEAFIPANSPLEGKTISDSLAKRLDRLRILEVIRNGIRIPGNTNNIILEAGDRLLIALSPHVVSKTHQTKGIELSGALGEGLTQINRSEGLIVEAIPGPDSQLIGRSILDSNFRQQYRLIPMALHRRGKVIEGDFMCTPIDHGDTLLLLGTLEALEALRGSEDIVIIDKPPLNLTGNIAQMVFTLAVVLGVIIAATTGWMPIAASAIVGSVILMTFRAITPKQAYQSIHWSILFLIISMLGFGAAMEHTGTSIWLSNGLLAIITDRIPTAYQPLALLAGLYFITTVLTEILSNNAAAILLSTLALSMAVALDISARPLLIAIAVAASASFATPIGYQTNTYVYGIGGYKFMDFIRIGVPLNFIAFILSMLIIPLFWKF